jgi:TP901 family phage tail tape measure protein
MAINLPIVSRFDDKGIKDAEGALGKFGAAATAAAAVAVAAVTGIVVASVKAFAEFEGSLNKSLAIMGDVSDAMKNEMSDAAREVAKQTSFSASEAADAYFFLASAGLSAEQSIAALPQVAKFAQAGMFDMARATDLATDAQSALGLTSDDAAENLANLTRVTDVFVKANTLANTSVEQLATAFTVKAGNALKTLGKDVEEGAAVLALFADQGIKGEQAGTLLTNTLFGLTDRARMSSEGFKQLGIEVFDAEGNMKNLADIADDFTVALDGMTTEQQINTIAQLGFNKQARTGLLALIGNADAIREYEGELRNAGGTVEEVAEKQLRTFNGQLGLFKSEIADAGLSIGKVFLPAFGEMLDSLSRIVRVVAPGVIVFFEHLADLTTDAALAFADFADIVQFEGLDGVIHRLMDFRQALIVGIIEAIPGLIAAFVEMLPKLVEFITGTMIPQILEQFTTIMTMLLEVIVTAVPMLVEAFAAVIPGILTSLAELLPEILTTLLEMMPDLLETMTTVFTTLITAIGVILPSLITTLVNLLPVLVDTLMKMLPDILETGIKMFFEIVRAVVKVLPDILKALVAALPVILDTLVKMLPQLLDMGIQMFFQIVEAVFEILPDLIAALIGMLPQIIATLLGFIPRLLVLGGELIAGIVKGIMQAIPRLIGGAMRFLFDSITKSVKSLFGISSPSKVFAEFGGDMVDGLANGLKSGANEVRDAVAEIAEATDAAFNDYSGKLTAESKISGGLTSGMIRANLEATAITPSSMSSAGMAMDGGQQNYNITVNAGMGANGTTIGQQIVEEILRYERRSGRVFARS